MSVMLLAFWAKFQKYILMLGALVAFIGTVWFKGYRASQEKFKRRQEAARERQRRSKEKIREKVRNSNDPDLDRRLDRWMRD